jgi:hypothetical protein
MNVLNRCIFCVHYTFTVWVYAAWINFLTLESTLNGTHLVMIICSVHYHVICCCPCVSYFNNNVQKSLVLTDRPSTYLREWMRHVSQWYTTILILARRNLAWSFHPLADLGCCLIMSNMFALLLAYSPGTDRGEFSGCPKMLSVVTLLQSMGYYLYSHLSTPTRCLVIRCALSEEWSETLLTWWWGDSQDVQGGKNTEPYLFSTGIQLSWVSVVSIVTRLWAELYGVLIPGEGKRYLFSITSRLALGPTEPPFHCVTQGLSGWGMKMTTHFHLLLRLEH